MSRGVHQTTNRLRWAAMLALPLPALLAAVNLAPRNAAFAEERAADLPAEASADHTYVYTRQNVLGTSLDLKIVAPTQSDADACEKTILYEMQRLSAILSTYNPESEISRFEADPSTEFINVSEDLHAVLLDYQLWHIKSDGAYSAQLGELSALWEAAEKKGTMPTDAEIAPIVARLRHNPYVASNSDNSVRKLTSQPLNVDSLGKGYIVQRAAMIARLKHPAVTGILLNIGGDITALGFATPPGASPQKAWEVAVANPQRSADNAAPLTTLHLSNKAVATSGAYERFYKFGDKKLSHILNPLTGHPATSGVASATVVAPDDATANALATILCVVPKASGIGLVEHTPGAAALLVTDDGRQIRSKNFAAYESDAPAAVASGGGEKPTTPVTDGPGATPAAPAAPAAGGVWPTGFLLAMDMTILPFRARPGEVPYAAVWIEDAHGQCVKILAAWVGNKRYLGSLRTFFPIARASDFANVTRSTRRAGRYTMEWDGTDASNHPVPRGEYSLCVEVTYEHGGHSFDKLAVNCGDAKTTATIPSAALWNDIAVYYGPAR